MRKICLFPVVLTVLLAACAGRVPDGRDGEVTSARKVNAIDDLLAYYQSLRRLSPAEVTRELQALGARSDGGAMLAMQKAIALGLTRDPNDLVRAQVQLGNVLNATDPGAITLRPLANVLSGNYSEMRRLAENAEKAGLQLRESQRRLEQLNEKLEALKAIERTLPVQVK